MTRQLLIITISNSNIEVEESNIKNSFELTGKYGKRYN